MDICHRACKILLFMLLLVKLNTFFSTTSLFTQFCNICITFISAVFYIAAVVPTQNKKMAKCKSSFAQLGFRTYYAILLRRSTLSCSQKYVYRNLLCLKCDLYKHLPKLEGSYEHLPSIYSNMNVQCELTAAFKHKFS